MESYFIISQPRGRDRLGQSVNWLLIVCFVYTEMHFETAQQFQLLLVGVLSVVNLKAPFTASIQ